MGKEAWCGIASTTQKFVKDLKLTLLYKREGFC